MLPPSVSSRKPGKSPATKEEIHHRDFQYRDAQQVTLGLVDAFLHDAARVETAMPRMFMSRSNERKPPPLQAGLRVVIRQNVGLAEPHKLLFGRVRHREFAFVAEQIELAVRDNE